MDSLLCKEAFNAIRFALFIDSDVDVPPLIFWVHIRIASKKYTQHNIMLFSNTFLWTLIIHMENAHKYEPRDVRNPDFCKCENKDADQLRGNREADQRLCFRYMDSTIPLLPKSEISSP